MSKKEIKLSELPSLLSLKIISPKDIFPIESGVAARIYTAYVNSLNRETELMNEITNLKNEIIRSKSCGSKPFIVYG